MTCRALPRPLAIATLAATLLPTALLAAAPQPARTGFDTMPDAPRNPMRRAARVAVVALTVLCGAACSIRQDATGDSRTGILLWGFGDPPGVDWNLDRPRREVPDLPASRHPELPPRAVEPGWWSSDGGSAAPHATGFVHPWRCAPSLREGTIRAWDGPARSCDRRESAIGDNRACVSCNLSEAACPLAVRALDSPLVRDCG